MIALSRVSIDLGLLVLAALVAWGGTRFPGRVWAGWVVTAFALTAFAVADGAANLGEIPLESMPQGFLIGNASLILVGIVLFCASQGWPGYAAAALLAAWTWPILPSAGIAGVAGAASVLLIGMGFWYAWSRLRLGSRGARVGAGKGTRVEQASGWIVWALLMGQAVLWVTAGAAEPLWVLGLGLPLVIGLGRLLPDRRWSRSLTIIEGVGLVGLGVLLVSLPTSSSGSVTLVLLVGVLAWLLGGCWPVARLVGKEAAVLLPLAGLLVFAVAWGRFPLAAQYWQVAAMGGLVVAMGAGLVEGRLNGVVGGFGLFGTWAGLVGIRWELMVLLSVSALAAVVRPSGQSVIWNRVVAGSGMLAGAFGVLGVLQGGFRTQVLLTVLATTMLAAGLLLLVPVSDRVAPPRA